MPGQEVPTAMARYQSNEIRRSAMVKKRPNSPRNRGASPRGYVNPDEMCDYTKISGATWGDLKEQAMEPDYLKKSTFARYLSKNEKETLRILIEKQTV